MFSRKHWNILIVDDEPDIHEVTKLTLKKEEFWGAKLKLHHASSAAEATEMLRNDPGLVRTLAVALVDVVMETDQAGLDFCRFVRDELRRQSVQLILRTGQPGQAPPRKIIDELNISGYLTKLEAAGDRLYMEVKSAIQAHYDGAMNETWSLFLDVTREKCDSRDQLADALRALVNQEFGHGNELHVGYDFFGERYVGGGALADKATYDAIIPELLKKAQEQLETGLGTSYYGGSKFVGSSKGIAVKTPNRVAQVDDYVVVQTPVIGRPKDQLATLVMKNPTYPRRLLWYYGPTWRSHLAWLAEAMKG